LIEDRSGIEQSLGEIEVQHFGGKEMSRVRLTYRFRR
jgi:hypothetical protein